MNTLSRIGLSLFLIFFSSQGLISQQAQFSIQALFGPTGYLMFDETYYLASQQFNYSAGAYFLANIPVQESRISFRSGYYYDTKRYTRSYNVTHSYSKSKVVTSYAYGNIPILIEIAFKTREVVYPFISLGVIFGWLLSAEQNTELGNGETIEGFPPRSYNLEKQTDFHACAGANFRLNRILLIRVEAFMGQQLTKDDGSNYDCSGFFSYGLKAGLQFDIHLSGKSKE